MVLAGERFESAEVSVAVVDDARIHELNRRYLNHDYATDVLSFVLDERPGHVEGEVIVSVDTAVRSAERFGWEPCDELLLYVVHGTLHLTGHDDHDPAALATMREAERQYLAKFDVAPRYEETTPAHHGGKATS